MKYFSLSTPTSSSNKNNGSSLTASTINLANTVIGAGMLGLPGAFAACGYVTGTILLVSAAVFSAIGLRLLSLSAALVDQEVSNSTRVYEMVEVSDSPSFLNDNGDCNDLVGTCTENEDDDVRGVDGGKHVVPIEISKEWNGKKKNASFYSIAQASVSSNFVIMIDLAVALKCFGVATGYFITVGDCMVDAMKYLLPAEDEPISLTTGGTVHDNHYAFLLSRRIWITLGLFVAGPISFLPSLDALKFASTLSLCLILALGIGIVLFAEGVLEPCNAACSYGYSHNLTNSTIGFYGSSSEDFSSSQQTIDDDYNTCCSDSTEINIHLHATTDFRDTVKYVAIFVFSFTCHQNIFSVYNEIEKYSQRRIDFVILTAIIMALSIYFIVALEGYRTYGENVQSDILRSYPKSLIVTMMRIAIAFMVCLSYPLQLNPARKCISSLSKSLGRICPIKRIFSAQTDNQSQEDQEQLNNFVLYSEHVIVTSSFLTLSYIIAMIVEDLGIVLAVVGATGSTMVTYILPGVIYFKLSYVHDTPFFMKSLAYLQCTLGFIIVPVALYFIVKYHVAGA